MAALMEQRQMWMCLLASSHNVAFRRQAVCTRWWMVLLAGVNITSRNQHCFVPRRSQNAETGILGAVIRRNRWKLMILVFPTKGRQSWNPVEKHQQGERLGGTSPSFLSSKLSRIPSLFVMFCYRDPSGIFPFSNVSSLSSECAYESSRVWAWNKLKQLSNSEQNLHPGPLRLLAPSG